MYDGMSCGHIALDKLGVEIASYHATEIDKFAVQTTQANFLMWCSSETPFRSGKMAGPMQDLPAGPRRRRNEAHCEGRLLPHVRGCRFLITEPWLNDIPSFRCGADGRWQVHRRN